MKTIEIEINTDGEVKIETTGFKGNACERLTAELEKSLGVVGTRHKKPEYNQSATTQQKAGAS